jgi:hypothetical protein
MRFWDMQICVGSKELNRQNSGRENGYSLYQNRRQNRGMTDEVNRKNFYNLSKYLIDRPHPISNFIGWPIVSDIGGFSFDDKLEDHHRLSDEDTHPNASGHKLIAEIFYNEYEKIYS